MPTWKGGSRQPSPSPQSISKEGDRMYCVLLRTRHAGRLHSSREHMPAVATYQLCHRRPPGDHGRHAFPQAPLSNRSMRGKGLGPVPRAVSSQALSIAIKLLCLQQVPMKPSPSSEAQESLKPSHR